MSDFKLADFLPTSKKPQLNYSIFSSKLKDHRISKSQNNSKIMIIAKNSSHLSTNCKTEKNIQRPVSNLK
jgi:hypothetical protein